MNYKNLKKKDREVYNILFKERKRREDTLEMIPSENHTSPAALEGLATIFNDKYSEGYPKKRYYGGNEFIDMVEILCQERARKLFNVPHANVQPYSGSPANHAAYFAVLKPGEKALGMDLSVGGHLTHGTSVNFSGRYYKALSYGVDKKTGRVDFKEMEKIAKKEKPKLIWASTSAYPRVLEWKKFRKVADLAGAYLVADIAHIAGLIISGDHPSPVPYAHLITTTTHKTLRGPRGGIIMVTKEGLKKDKNLIEKVDRAVFPGTQAGPHEHQIAGVAVCLKEASGKNFQKYGHQIIKNSKTLANSLVKKGFRLVTGGTDNHLMVVDLRDKGISGKDAQELLDKAGITVNKNTVPFDPNPPFSPSGIRLGTPAVTTRKMKEKEMERIADFITQVIKKRDKKTVSEIRGKVKNLCRRFPIP